MRGAGGQAGSEMILTVSVRTTRSYMARTCQLCLDYHRANISVPAVSLSTTHSVVVSSEILYFSSDGLVHCQEELNTPEFVW